jgi:hypothetical protein
VGIAGAVDLYELYAESIYEMAISEELLKQLRLFSTEEQRRVSSF